MSSAATEVHAVDWRHLFPWIRIFRAFWIAADLRKLILGGLALVAIAAGNWGLSWLPFSPHERGVARFENRTDWPWEIRLFEHESASAQPSATSEPSLRMAIIAIVRSRAEHAPTTTQGLESFLRNPAETLWETLRNWPIVLRPVWTVLDPASDILEANSPGFEKTWSDAAWGWARLLWALAVWAVFGGAITRLAAVQFARDEKLSVWSALRFSLSKFVGYFTAPLLPAFGLIILWGLLALGGLIGRIPEVGPVVVAIFWFLALAVGFVMSLLLVGLAFGWPLMYATISTEATDGFDGFSRSYSYVFSRPWHYLGYAIVALAYGAVVIFFAAHIAQLIAGLANWGVRSGMGESAFFETIGRAGWALQGSESPVSSHIAAVWLAVLSTLLQGFIVSFFWTAWTILYFLLRRADDATDFNEVSLANEPERDDLLPLVGVAATEHAPMERPVRPENPQAAGPPHENEE